MTKDTNETFPAIPGRESGGFIDLSVIAFYAAASRLIIIIIIIIHGFYIELFTGCLKVLPTLLSLVTGP